jgi:hypothetical protein
MQPLSWETKKPTDTLDYIVEWTDWLGRNNYITAASFAVDNGSQLNVVNSSFTNTISTVYLSAGQNHKMGVVTCTITTTDGRTGSATVYIQIRD